LFAVATCSQKWYINNIVIWSYYHLNYNAIHHRLLPTCGLQPNCNHFENTLLTILEMQELQQIQAAYSGAQLCVAALYINCIATYRTTVPCAQVWSHKRMRTRCWSKTWPTAGYHRKCQWRWWGETSVHSLNGIQVFVPLWYLPSCCYCWMCTIDKLGTSVGEGLTTSYCHQS